MMFTCTKTTFKSQCGNNDVVFVYDYVSCCFIMASLASNTTQINDNSGKKKSPSYFCRNLGGLRDLHLGSFIMKLMFSETAKPHTGLVMGNSHIAHIRCVTHQVFNCLV